MSRIYVALDLETTGLKPERDAIIEIGAVKFRGKEVLETWSSLVNPGRPLPYRIQQLTGITPEELENAPSLFSIMGPLVSFVKDYPIVGHNVPFDLSFLNRHGLFLANPTIDTFELASILMPYASRYSLSTLAQHLGIHFPKQHRALADALAAKDLFLALVERAGQLDLATIREINRLAARSDWPLRYVFRDAERDRARTAFTGTIAQQLLAKGGLDEGALGLFFSEGQCPEPLQPSPRRQPLDVEALCALLEEGGLFAQHFPGYEHRPQQVHMLRAVAEAFNEGEHLLVEGGTGVGKSLAYLLPAIHFAVANGRHVVVSTNTINLQDQLFNKDLPDLQRILALEFKASLLKGRSNYLCRRRLDLLRRRDDLSVDEIRVLAKILAWLPTTTTGDVAELTLVNQEGAIWNRVCAEAETCRPDTCTYKQGERCFFYRARHQAEGAHIIVVNHALLLSDMAVENRVLPEYQHLIIDEAHHLEARATEQLGFSVDRRGVDATLNELSSPALRLRRAQSSRLLPKGQPSGAERSGGFLAKIVATLRASSLPSAIRREVESYIEGMHRDVERARQHLYRFFDVLALFLEEQRAEGRSHGGYDLQVRLTGGQRIQPAWANVEMAWDDLSLTLAKIHQGLERLYTSFLDPGDHDIPQHDELLGELAGHRHRMEELREQMTAIISQPSPNGIYWATLSAQGGEVSLHAAPLHVGQLLEKHLFSSKECVVLTSATLQAGDDFSYIRERLGLWDVREEAVGSPFDYAASTLLYLPTDIPEPGQPYYQKTVERVLVDLCQATQGRTLVLFTSHSQLQATYKAISQPLGEAGIAVLGQGLDGSRRQLLETFKENDRTVLLGTRSFWEGIDVVGEALSCLVIARLPFDVPTDPIFAARSETFEDPFGQYAVPQTILRFRQGFGRLIRSKTDRGVVVVLDKRLLTKFYGPAFLNSLPPCTVRRGSLHDLPPAAARWIDGETPYQPGLGF
ncbi:MAG: helicase C-terminal domain-containing protein [Anaerolineae bacterium]